MRLLCFALPALLIAAPASAQMAVFDVKNFRQIVQQLASAREQLAVVTRTYNQAVDAYNDIHGLTNIDGVARVLDSSAVRDWLPPGTQSLQALISGSGTGLGSFGRAAADIRAGRRVALPPLPSDASEMDRISRASLEARGEAAARDAAIAEAVYGAGSARRTGLDQLQTALANATTDKERQALQARIALEQARIQNDTIQFQAVQARQAAERQLWVQQRSEQDAANLAADLAGGER